MAAFLTKGFLASLILRVVCAVKETIEEFSDHEGEAMHVFDIFETDGELMILLFMTTLMIAFIFGNLLHYFHISFIPESLIVILLGLLMGNVEILLPGLTMPSIEQDAILNKKLLNMVFLPIIIFEAGFSLKNQDFMAQLPYILIFAIFGTVICMCVVAFLTVQSCSLHGICDWRTAFTYGALISAVDPVATLATYAHLNVEPLLSIMVMGESIINDAVAIVLFHVLNTAPAGYFDQSLSRTAGDICLGVVKLLGGSVCLGLGFGVLYILILRFAKMRFSPSLEILFIFLSCFNSYAFAEHVCEMSGIITVLFQGMIMGTYATPHLTQEGALLCNFLLKQMASLADMMVFLFVGLGLVFETSTGLTFGFCVMFFCLVGRAVAVAPLGVLCNAIKSKTERSVPEEQRGHLSWRHLFMMWHAGLRGGIAVVLVLDLGPWVDAGTKEVLRNATLLLVCVFLLVFGGSTEILLKALKIPLGNPPPMYVRGGCFQRFMGRVDGSVLQPILVGPHETRQEMHGGIVEKILADAKVQEEEIYAVSSDAARARSRRETTTAYDLFGQDPLHTTRVIEAEVEESDEEEEGSEDSERGKVAFADGAPNRRLIA
eukprot:TRINITY_DN71159_c0_g1_i1.p1 TRINITY_DN71159_c0_g1~~TRINITY_DN71159_c0_g1_i1.p1  ORF type:complete len:603 (-),score=126.65 TRINITY_DN71159_c0_g1_i1:112-1920(-)